VHQDVVDVFFWLKKRKPARKTQKITTYWNQNSAKYHNIS